MKHLDLNTFMIDVHQNAIAHGWWEKESFAGTIRSLIHAELSEALEEYRETAPWCGMLARITRALVKISRCTTITACIAKSACLPAESRKASPWS